MEKIMERLLGDPGFPEGIAWRRRTFEAGEVVVREGEPGGTLYYVESGRLRVTARVELEDRCRLRPGLQDLGPGETFGELSLFGDGKRSATVTALEPVRLIEIDGPALERHLEAHPDLGYAFLRALLRSLATRLARTDHQMEHLFAWGLRAHGLERHL